MLKAYPKVDPRTHPEQVLRDLGGGHEAGGDDAPRKKGFFGRLFGG